MNEKRIHQVFEISLLLKAAHAAIECVSGLLLAVISTDTIVYWVQMLTQAELIEDPQDFIARQALTWAAGFSVSTQHFYAFYLLSHGIVKAALVIGLLRNKLWSYPASLVIMSLFIAYQVYRYSYTHSFGLIILTVFDIIVIALIWHEYRLVRRNLMPST